MTVEIGRRNHDIIGRWWYY